MIINPFDNEQEFTSSDKLITHLTQLAVDKNNVFRGYGKQSELFPNIIREKDWREQEIRLLHEFERYGLQYFSANNPIDFMSYAATPPSAPADCFAYLINVTVAISAAPGPQVYTGQYSSSPVRHRCCPS